MLTVKDSSKADNQQSYQVFEIFALLMIPLCGSMVQITLRSMRNLSSYTQAFYHSIFTGTIMGLVILINGDDLFFLSTFNLEQWLLLFISLITSFANVILKQMALQYDTASRVTMYNYLQSFMLVTIDITIFDYVFHEQEILGLTIVLAINFVLIGRILFEKGK